MQAWRLTRRPFADLSGSGGLYAAGRWHARGRPVLYAGLTPAVCLLEFLVNAELVPDLLPDDLVLLRLDVPADLPLTRLDAADLPPDWRSLDGRAACRAAGEAWLDGGETVGLLVPSAVLPQETNLILNPRHPRMAAVRIAAIETFAFDSRLLRHGEH